MNVNEKGVRGLLKVMDDLHEKGYYTFTPFDDHSPVDLIAMDKDGKIYRLQVKYRERISGMVVERYGIPASSVVNGKRIPIDRSMIDGWAVYLADAKKVVYLRVGLLDGKSSISIDPEKDYGKLDEWFISTGC